MARTRHQRMDDTVMYDDESSTDGYDQNVSLIIVIVSLLFVAVFGGALAGGVVSGDPSNGFFLTIIVASCIAVAVGVLFLIRYWLKNQLAEDDMMKQQKPTFSNSEDEEEGVANNEQKEENYPDRFIPNTPPGRHVKEVKTMRSLAGDVSAISPCTYDVESLGGDSGVTSYADRIIQNRSRQQRGKSGFDFSSVTSASRGQDPPDTKESSLETQETKKKKGPRDPSVVTIAMDGNVRTIVEEDDTDVGLNTPTSYGGYSKNKNLATPASAAGSFASSIFKPLNGFFGKKKDSSGVESSSVPSGPQAAGRPPKRPEAAKKYLETINGKLEEQNLQKNAPSTPSGQGSVVSIPPPRRVPSSPTAGSDAEFKSTADSVVSDSVASSTFDPQAHQRALVKVQENTASLGADSNDMPIYYEDEEERGVYDVFAPSGPMGIVVDSGPRGCFVHSLKKTSSMRGLINPGDIIIALDDEDVQKMDAASLTKLMARKSHQKERRMTLIAAEA